MCWCQKWFLKNEKTSLVCISVRNVIWKATATTLPNIFSSSYKRNKHARSRFLNAEDAGKQMSLQEGIASERSLIRRHMNSCEDRRVNQFFYKRSSHKLLMSRKVSIVKQSESRLWLATICVQIKREDLREHHKKHKLWIN